MFHKPFSFQSFNHQKLFVFLNSSVRSCYEVLSLCWGIAGLLFKVLNIFTFWNSWSELHFLKLYPDDTVPQLLHLSHNAFYMIPLHQVWTTPRKSFAKIKHELKIKNILILFGITKLTSAAKGTWKSFSKQDFQSLSKVKRKIIKINSLLKKFPAGMRTPLWNLLEHKKSSNNCTNWVRCNFYLLWFQSYVLIIL